jgi:predicted nucleic acid-binding protein
MKVLVDTPVWIDHLHRADATLQRLLAADVVHLASPILGELAAGNLPHRRRTLTDLRMIRRLTEPSAEEVLDWVEMRSLGGKGLSWVDCLLLATAEQNRAAIYTRDRILAREAAALKVAFAS